MCLIDCDLLEELKTALEDEVCITRHSAIDSYLVTLVTVFENLQTLDAKEEEINDDVLKESQEEMSQFLQRECVSVFCFIMAIDGFECIVVSPYIFIYVLQPQAI